MIVHKALLPKLQEIHSRLTQLQHVICIRQSGEGLPDYETSLSESSDHEPEAQRDVQKAAVLGVTDLRWGEKINVPT